MVSSITYWVHIAAGIIALGSGIVALTTGKGSPRHRLAGKLFVVSMMTVAVTAVALAVVRPVPLLLYLGIFSGYLAGSGRLALTRKRLPVETPAPGAQRWLPGIMGVVALGFGAFAVVSADLLLMIFAGLGILRSSTEFRHMHRGWADKAHWIIEHQFSMGTALIAATTAFVVVNVGRITASPIVGFVAWLGPTLIGVPLLIRTTRRLKDAD